MIEDDAPDDSYLYKSDWILLTSNLSWFQKSSFAGATVFPATAPPGFRAMAEWEGIFTI